MATSTQTVSHTKTIDSSNISAKKIEIQLMDVWSPNFTDTNYTVVSSSLATRVVTGSTVDLHDTFIEAGDRDRTVSGIIVVLDLLTDSGRTNYSQIGDVVQVNLIAIGNV